MTAHPPPDLPLIAMRGIVKRYPGVTALGGVDLFVDRAEVMGLVGENGAGKSTLLKVLAGAEHADEGSVELHGEPVALHTPRDAQRAGIAVIYQELNLAEHLSVAENIFAGREPRTRWGSVNFAGMHRRSRELLAELGIAASPNDVVGRLNVALRQLVEIAKALSVDARIIVMDEPTSALTAPEVRTLLDLVRRLRARGVSVIYVSHRLREVFEIADRITVLRDGQLVGVDRAAELTPSQVVRMMVGRELTDLYGQPDTGPDRLAELPPALAVRDLYAGPRVRGVSFSVRPGEILGIAGLVGAGRSETAHAVFGAAPRESGEILVAGRRLEPRHPRQAIAAGLGFVPEDRKLQGLFLGLPVRVNISAASLREVRRRLVVSRRSERALTHAQAGPLGLRAASAEATVRTLSGGNQQKVVLARWLARRPRVLLLDEPTRGVDVGAKAEIYRIIRSAAARGVAVVVISSELPEVLGISDRVVVMRQGRVVGELDRAAASEHRVMALATGITEDVA